MSNVLAIDPGPKQSAWIRLVNGEPREFATWPNEQLLEALRRADYPVSFGADVLVIEKVEAFGMAVGAEVFETVYWSGQFAEAAARQDIAVDRVGRKAVKIHLCGSMRAKDPNIRAALLDRFGGSAAKGTKAAPGPLYGFAGDHWSALAVGVTWADLHP